jgi:tetratricopeptide (TPR) repeat protein
VIRSRFGGSKREFVVGVEVRQIYHILKHSFDTICAKAIMKIVLSALLLMFAQKDIYKEGKAQLDAKHYDEAEAEFRQLLGSGASSSKGYEGLALVEIARKNYDKALENAKKAVELNEESAGAHYALGLVRAYRQDFENAAPSLEKALSLDPDNAQTHYQLALVQFRLKRFDQTIAHCERFIELTPNAPEAPQVKSLQRTAIRILIDGDKTAPGPII